ncbi:MAG: HEAT repeat domain-containing protein [Calditrichaeota bacterium]|nr:HEAT repeat domain-containing protein [Calditrichota bacterium]
MNNEETLPLNQTEDMIDALIKDLANDEVIVRKNARDALVNIGHPVIERLEELCKSKNDVLKWEAIKALSQIADVQCLTFFIVHLENENPDFRWLAAEGLIGLGTASIKPLLKALIKKSSSVYLKRGVHHVLQQVVEGELKEIFQPILLELKETEEGEQVAVLAWALLRSIER